MNILAKYTDMLPRAPEDGGGATPSAPVSSPDSSAGASPAPSPSSQTSPASSDGSTKVEGEVRNEPATNPFDTMGAVDDLDFIELPPDTGPSGTSEAPAVAQPESTTAKDPAEAKAPASPEAPKTPAAAQPTASSAPQATTAPAAAPTSSPAPVGPEAVLQGLEAPEAQAALRGFLAQDLFKLSDAEKVALDTDAVGAIPDIMARVHLEGTKNTLKLLSTLVPQMVEARVQQFQERQTKSASALSDFYKAWPALKAGEHDTLVGQFSRMFRQSNPQASRADAIKFVGSAIHAHLGLSPAAPAAAPAVNGKTPPPFAPARPGARPIVSQVVDDLPFGGLGQTFDGE